MPSGRFSPAYFRRRHTRLDKTGGTMRLSTAITLASAAACSITFAPSAAFASAHANHHTAAAHAGALRLSVLSQFQSSIKAPGTSGVWGGKPVIASNCAPAGGYADVTNATVAHASSAAWD
jgi:hypothetical protein